MSERSDIPDITPLHEPIGVAKDMLERAPGCITAVGILVLGDGSMWFDSAGHARKDVLWALTRMIHELMNAED